MHKSLATVLISTTLAVSLPVSAHTEQHFDNITTPHGGQMRMAGPYHLELVTKDKEIVLYVTDHGDNNVATEGGVGKASIQVGKAKPKTSVKLEPAGDNMLRGSGDFSVTPDTAIIVFLKLPEYEAQSARFTPLKPKAKPAKKSQAGKTPAGANEAHDHHMHH
ncbi:hypothetical protein [Nitrosovibrio tenuis]|uniref:Copper(I)-binding protein n=1 Tax=Nitrosovibrio tenuis TaxID=1233 RepID=A0A1H7M245_9PROT|nr:hypothetical protein [Nitrosovibrio tenuis]SEL05172.1 hypothetical protein SAMN05216387_104228 [Nitrosovibrio tenuis]